MVFCESESTFGLNEYFCLIIHCRPFGILYGENGGKVIVCRQSGKREVELLIRFQLHCLQMISQAGFCFVAGPALERGKRGLNVYHSR